MCIHQIVNDRLDNSKKMWTTSNESVDGKKYRKSTNNGLRAINIASGSSDYVKADFICQEVCNTVTIILE